MKKVIRLTESDIHRILYNSVKRILKEMETPKNQSMNIGTVINDLNNGVPPNEIKELNVFNDEQVYYAQDEYMLKDNEYAVGTLLDDNYLIVFDMDKNSYNAYFIGYEY